MTKVSKVVTIDHNFLKQAVTKASKVVTIDYNFISLHVKIKPLIFVVQIYEIPSATNLNYNMLIYIIFGFKLVQSICAKKWRFREVIPNKGIPLPRCLKRSPETPPKFAAPPDVEKCHFRATPIWIMGKFRDI